MITILWLIRSNQGISRKGGVTFWQDNWFLAATMTFGFLFVDFVAIGVLSQIIISL